MKKFTIQSAMSKAIAIMIAVIIICGVICAVSYDANPGIFTGFAVASNVLIVATGVCCGIFAIATHAIDMEYASENLPIENLCYRAFAILVFGFGCTLTFFGTALFAYCVFHYALWPVIIAGFVFAVPSILLAVAMVPLCIVKNHLVNKAANVEFE